MRGGGEALVRNAGNQIRDEGIGWRESRDWHVIIGLCRKPNQTPDRAADPTRNEYAVLPMHNCRNGFFWC